MRKRGFLLVALAGGALFGQQKTSSNMGLTTTFFYNGQTTTVTSASTVANEPYSATGITEHTQTLSDGTHLRTETQYTIYRDAAGRERRETPTAITIIDPVAHTSYRLNPANHTYVEQKLNTVTAGLEALDRSVAVTLSGPQVYTFRPAMAPPGSDRPEVEKTTTEALGTQNIQGVNAVGTRRTETIPVGQIGNDRPIQIVNEWWESPDLQVTVMTKESDPRGGETVFQLTNISRNPPDPNLFQVPAGYQPAAATGGRRGPTSGGGER